MSSLRQLHSKPPARRLWPRAVLLAAVAGLVLFCFDPRQYHFYPVCFFHTDHRPALSRVRRLARAPPTAARPSGSRLSL